MATYDVTGPSNAGARPGRFSAGVRTPYLVENTIDIAAINSDAGTATGDVLQAIDIPAETLIVHAGMEILTQLSNSVTVDLGITGGDVDNFVDGDAKEVGYSVLTATARLVIASADTLDVLMLSAASSAGKIRVWALLCDVSGVEETDRNSATQHDG
jgi:hypothetical protein